ncbi:MAG: hypothetical protein ACTHKP_09180, partial [Nitrososphaeraceae archaeon]
FVFPYLRQFISGEINGLAKTMSNNRGHSRFRHGPNSTYSSSSIIRMTMLITVNRFSIIEMSQF